MSKEYRAENGPKELAHRCLICGTPLYGVFGYVARLFGITRSTRNPNFCNRCNTHVEAGRLIEITVLFADLSSFTQLTHELGADRAFEIANAFLQMSTYELVKRGAFIDKYIGDAVMAIFNVPLPAPDHPARAVAAAMEILEQTEKLGPRFDRPLAAGVGIASGWAHVGSLGSDDERHFTAVGEVVNVAARLEGKTEAGEILADATVYQQVAGEFPGVGTEILSLKGLGEPLPAYRLRATGRNSSPPRTFSNERPGGGRSFAFSALILSVLGAPCAATVSIGPLAVAIGLGSIAGVTGALAFLDDWRIRFPLVTCALLGTLVTLHSFWRSPHRRSRDAYIICGSAIFTFLVIGFELYAHRFIEHHPWP